MKPSCKTCATWEPFNAVCFNGDSDERGDFTDRNFSCKHWAAHKCPECGGVMEAKESEGDIWHVCPVCMREFPYNPYKQ